MGPTPTFGLYDRLLGGRLTTLLTEWRAEEPKVAYTEIARRLAGLDVDVTSETVRRWAKELGLEQPTTTKGER